MDKAKHYSRVKYQLEIISNLYAFLLLLVFQSSGLSLILAAGIEGLTSIKLFAVCAYIFAVYIGHYILTFPINFYGSFVVERGFQLSTQKFSCWLADQMKSLAIYFIISVAVTEVFYYILNRCPDTWWLILAAFVICFTLVFSKLLPVVIIPLFFKYKTLADNELRSRIIALAGKMKVKLIDVFEINLSKKTLKANAAFVGVGSTRRVLLADTLADKYTHEEIEVIIAHEFAHYKSRHMLKLIAVNSLVSLTAFYLIFKTSLPVLMFFHLGSLSDIAALPIIMIYLMLFGIITQPITNCISRAFERNADIIALKETGEKEAFISMMEKLALQNLADRAPSKLIKLYFFDHPPIDERIALAKNSV